MAEVRDIGKDEKRPENSDHVLIERAGSRFVANGSVAGKIDATFFAPPSFDTEQAAIGAAQAWCAANDVAVIYVRGVR